jgi:FixJ family two-component response regulator
MPWSGHTHGTIHIIEDDSFVRSGLEGMLRNRGFQVKSFPSAEDFLRDDGHAECDCLIVDLCLPALNGLHVQELLAQRAQPIPIIFISGRGSISAAVQAVQRGAITFLEKPIDADELAKAIRIALSRASEISRFKTLTARERIVAVLAARGEPNKQIAAQLNLAQSSVGVYRAISKRKLGARSTADLVRIVDATGLRL